MHALFDEWLKLATALGEQCVASRRIIAGAESCTGGLISAVLTSVGGSSAWVDRALVTYSNAAKVALLGVHTATLDAHGAVSEETAREMALGALRPGRDDRAANLANIAYSVTGIAGPTGGTESKPVGLVCFAFAVADNGQAQIMSVSRRFDGDRSAAREQSVNFVLAELLRLAARPSAATSRPESAV